MQGGYPGYWGGTRTAGASPDTLGKVLGLLGLTAAATAAGAAVGPFVPGGFWIGLIGSIACVLTLGFVKERAPLNLILLLAFGAFEGIVLGLVLEIYVAAHMGLIVLDASACTAAVTLVAGAYGYTTKRDLSRFGSLLFIGLLVVIGASLLGFFIHLGPLQIVISAATALLFTGFLVFDLNRIARAGQVSEGDAILLAVSVYLDILNLFYALLRILTDLFGNSR